MRTSGSGCRRACLRARRTPGGSIRAIQLKRRENVEPAGMSKCLAQCNETLGRGEPNCTGGKKITPERPAYLRGTLSHPHIRSRRPRNGALGLPITVEAAAVMRARVCLRLDQVEVSTAAMSRRPRQCPATVRSSAIPPKPIPPPPEYSGPAWGIDWSAPNGSWLSVNGLSWSLRWLGSQCCPA